jgi:hypothetical protein
MPPDPLAGIHRLTDFEPIAPPGGATSVGRKTMLASLANPDVIG